MTVPAADLSALYAIVPVHGPDAAKSRLGGALDAEDRAELAIGLVRHTLDLLAIWGACRGVLVISDDARMIDLLAPYSPPVTLLLESRPSGLNDALRTARGAAVDAGANAALILPADLPLLSVAALDSLLEAADAAVAAGGGGPVVVIAPADARNGTNALLTAPVDVIEPLFGEHSFEAHLRAASAADASVQVVIDAALGFDLDTTDDLERLEMTRLLELQALGRALLGDPTAVAS
ncbi:hypothetical protein BH24CHL5_BH24CHL5_10130 [soil metagenome]